MQDYPPAPGNTTITIQLENHLPITYDKVITSPQTTLLSGYYAAYEAAYGALSGFLYNGLYNAELT